MATIDLKSLHQKYVAESGQKLGDARIREVRTHLIRQTIIEVRRMLEGLPKGLSIGHDDFVRIVEDGMFHAEKEIGVEYGEELFQQIGSKLVIQFELAATGKKVDIEVT